MKPTVAVALLLVAAAATACSGQNTPPAAPATVAEAPIPNTASPYDALPQAVRDGIGKPFIATSTRWSSAARFAWP
jgi:hypothetical protein